MNVYLAKLIDPEKNLIYIRISKEESDEYSIAIDHQTGITYTIAESFSQEGDAIDLLEIPVIPLTDKYPSLIALNKPAINLDQTTANKIKIRLYLATQISGDPNTSELYMDEVILSYDSAVDEYPIDAWGAI